MKIYFQILLKKLLNDNNFNIKMKAIEIVYNILSLNSLNINMELYKTGIIDQLIFCNLLNEEDKKNLNFILNGILYFINRLKALEPQLKIEIINNSIKIGILNGLENNTRRFNNEHILMIKQIEMDINNIINFKEDKENDS